MSPAEARQRSQNSPVALTVPRPLNKRLPGFTIFWREIVRKPNLGLCRRTLKTMEKARRLYEIWQQVRLSNKF